MDVTCQGEETGREAVGGRSEAGRRGAVRVGILPVPGFALMSYAGVVEPMRAANLLGGGGRYEVIHFGSQPDCPSSGAGWVRGARPFHDAPALDLLFVIAGGDPMAWKPPAVPGWLRRQAARGVTLGGVSGGPVILARAGLMRGYRMTVHWEHAPAVAELPGGHLLERALYVIDRDRVTCAGGTAPIDMMHALIAAHWGAEFARTVSDWFLHTDVRPPGGPQRGGLVERLGTRSRPVLAAVAAMERHVADPLSLAQLARHAGVTPRQLNRLFREKLGVSTMAHYRRLRLGVARRLMRQAPIALTEVALATGFAGSAHFSTAWRREFGYPPSRERADRPPAGGEPPGKE